MTPHWIDAPDWAQWLAQDEDGEWNWFQDKPQVMGRGEWMTLTGGNFEWARTTPCQRKWQKTLQAKPVTFSQPLNPT
jgi:hypothetical protein